MVRTRTLENRIQKLLNKYKLKDRRIRRHGKKIWNSELKSLTRTGQVYNPC